MRFVKKYVPAFNFPVALPRAQRPRLHVSYLSRLILKQMSWVDAICLLPLGYLIGNTFSFLGQAPSVDTMVIYRESTEFFSGGYKDLLRYNQWVHTPLVYLPNTIGFILFGKSPLSWNLVGLLALLCFSIWLYLLVKTVSGRKAAAAMVLLLFCNPMVMVNAFYPMSDLVLLYSVIVAATFYLYKKWVPLAITLALMVLMKETAIVVVGGIAIAWLAEILLFTDLRRAGLRELAKLIGVYAVPAVTFLLWILYVKGLHTTVWKDYTVVQWLKLGFIGDKDSSYVAGLKTIWHLKLNNPLLMQDLRNTLVANYQWVFTEVLVAGWFVWMRRFSRDTAEGRLARLWTAVALSYISFVFTFPTWTIPRYVIPVYLALFFAVAVALAALRNPIMYGTALAGLVIIALVGNVSSSDPVTVRLFGHETVSGETLYGTPYSYSGPDKVDYNLQFLNLVAAQNSFISQVILAHANKVVTDCNAVKLGEKMYSIGIHNVYYPQLRSQTGLDCIDTSSLSDANAVRSMQGSVVFVPQKDLAQLTTALRADSVTPRQLIIGD